MEEQDQDSTESDYQEALAILYGLPSNAETIRVTIARQARGQACLGLEITAALFDLTGLPSPAVLCQKLKIIHVAGTKGKGTTCAYVESILRAVGLRTGLYTSPHLVTVRERIRINGSSLSRDQFAKYFSSTYEKVVNAIDPPYSDLKTPAYFLFLTCMALHVFLAERVDVAILEVGIGGRYCATNVFPQPAVVGITTIGLDHVNIFGSDLNVIAYEKAGVMKPGIPVFVSCLQPVGITDFLRKQAVDVGCAAFHVAPSLVEYGPTTAIDNLKLGVDGEPSKVNAGLALQIAQVFLDQTSLDEPYSSIIGSPFQLKDYHLEGLANCKHLGRFQTLQVNPHLKYFFDGAHTKESLIKARDWFMNKIQGQSDEIAKVFVFCLARDRNPNEMLEPFLNLSAEIMPFEQVLFCPPVIFEDLDRGFKPERDNWSYDVQGHEASRGRCKQLQEIWNGKQPNVQCNSSNSSTARCMESINDTVDHLEQLSATKEVNVLVTGSLHLVGSFLSILENNATLKI